MGHVEYLLPDYVNNRLEESLRPGVEQHLSECASCRGELEVVREAFGALRGQEIHAPSRTYFTTILPRVRERLQKKESRPFYANPLISRILVPLAAGALVIFVLMRSPMPAGNSEAERNPLRPVLQDVASDELIDIVFEQQNHQALHVLGESETSALLAESLFRDDRVLTDSDHSSMMDGPILGGKVPEGLDQLSDSEINALVARLGERTIL